MNASLSKKAPLIAYVAFLRGINVGGNNGIRMGDLQTAFERLGFGDVRTVLASGNVVFVGVPMEAASLEKMIERKIKDTFGHDVLVTVRTLAEVRSLEASGVFGHAGEGTTQYVTFLQERLTEPGRKKKRAAPEGMRLVRVSPGEVCSEVSFAPNRGTTELMRFVEKEFGQKSTTRNRNTIRRILDGR